LFEEQEHFRADAVRAEKGQNLNALPGPIAQAKVNNFDALDFLVGNDDPGAADQARCLAPGLGLLSAGDHGLKIRAWAPFSVRVFVVENMARSDAVGGQAGAGRDSRGHGFHRMLLVAWLKS
jgi:hypothetical protein